MEDDVSGFEPGFFAGDSEAPAEGFDAVFSTGPARREGAYGGVGVDGVELGDGFDGEVIAFFIGGFDDDAFVGGIFFELASGLG